MLTREEQEQVIEHVKKMIRRDCANRSRVERGYMSERQRRVNSARDFEELADMLKEIG